MTPRRADTSRTEQDDPDGSSLAEENRRLREDLRAAEARFHSTVERSVDGVIVLDGQGLVRFANGSALKLFGRSADALIGSEFGFPAVVGELTEVDLLPPGGTPIVCEMRSSETTWEGDEAAVLVVLRDVTARRAAEEADRALFQEHAAREEAEAAVRRAEILDKAGRLAADTLDVDEIMRALARVVVEDLGDVCLIDVADGHGPLRRLVAARRDYPGHALLKGLEERRVSLDMNTAEARTFRAGRSDLIHEVTEQWLNDAASEHDGVHIFQTLEPRSLMMITLHAGSLPWGLVSILSTDSSRSFDQNDLLLAEELVRRTGIAVENARLFRLARESSRAKSDFLAVVSHELRTPLSAVIGYAGLLSEGIGGEINPKQREHLNAIRQSAVHLERLIDQIITFARLEGDREHVQETEVECGDILRDVATLIRPLIDKAGLALDVRLPDGPLRLNTDERKLSQILLNLATNAVKYTPDGTVTLAVESGPQDITFLVRDTGIGIPEDQLDAIFEPFFQLEAPQTRSRGGAGIGLSVVENLTRLLGGDIVVTANPEGGSTFSVRLPRN